MANNVLIGALRAEATLESGKFVDGAKKLRVEAKKTETQLKTSFSGMGNSVKGFGAALTAGLSIGLLSGIIRKSLDLANSIGDVAKQVGVTTKELQEFRYAASQVGVAQDVADKGLERLNVTLGKAEAGSRTAQKALGAVGVTLQDIKTKSRTEIFGQIADQMIKQGGAAKNAAAANAIFGESASKLTPLLDQGSKGMNQLAESAQRLGIVLSDQQIQQADETARKLDDVRRVLAAEIASVVVDNAQSITTLAGALAQLTGSIVNFLNSNPTAALAILGALAGGRLGGLPGAALGGFAGSVLGAKMASQKQLPPNAKLLRHNFIAKVDEAKALQSAGKTKEANAAYASAKRLRDRFIQAGGTIPGYNPYGTAPIPQFLAPKPPKGSSPHAKKGPRDRSEDVQYQFAQEMRRAQMDTLRAQQSLASSSDDRARIALQLLDLQKADQDAELQNRVRKAEEQAARGEITQGALEEVKAQAQSLQAEYDKAHALERQAIVDEQAAQKAEDAAALRDSAYDLQIEELQLQSSLAETNAEKRDVELRILALMKEQEKARLEAVIADKQSSDLAKAQAQQRLNELDNIYAGRAATVMQGTRGPLGDFKAQYGDITDELEQLKVDGIEGAADALLKLTEGFGSFRDAAISAIRSVLMELLKLQLMKGIASIIGGAAGGIGGGLAGGFSTAGLSFGGAIAGIPGIPGLAGGGSMRVLGNMGLDKNLLSLNGVPMARVNYGERIDVSNDNRGFSGGGGITVHAPITIHGNADRKTLDQAASAIQRRVAGVVKKGF